MEDEEESSFNNILLMEFIVSHHAVYYIFSWLFFLTVYIKYKYPMPTKELEQRRWKIVLNKNRIYIVYVEISEQLKNHIN